MDLALWWSHNNLSYWASWKIFLGTASHWTTPRFRFMSLCKWCAYFPYAYLNSTAVHGNFPNEDLEDCVIMILHLSLLWLSPTLSFCTFRVNLRMWIFQRNTPIIWLYSFTARLWQWFFKTQIQFIRIPGFPTSTLCAYQWKWPLRDSLDTFFSLEFGCSV